jgi:hypothetical protein
MMPEKSAVVDSMDGMEGLTNLDGDQGVTYNPT